MGVSDWKAVLFSETTSNLLVHLEKEEQVDEIQPRFDALTAADNWLDVTGVIVTARGSGSYDFVSRFFAPWVGINEDPVTGSAHTVLAPFWSKRIGKRRLHVHQASERGGNLYVELGENRVYIIGKATTVIEGHLIF